jgi:hypothetical protein
MVQNLCSGSRKGTTVHNHESSIVRLNFLCDDTYQKYTIITLMNPPLAVFINDKTWPEQLSRSDEISGAERLLTLYENKNQALFLLRRVLKYLI